MDHPGVAEEVAAVWLRALAPRLSRPRLGTVTFWPLKRLWKILWRVSVGCELTSGKLTFTVIITVNRQILY